MVEPSGASTGPAFPPGRLIRRLPSGGADRRSPFREYGRLFPPQGNPSTLLTRSFPVPHPRKGVRLSAQPMAKKVVAVIKLALNAGKANPAPPVGPALGQHGVNIMAFCKEYNARTQEKAGYVIPVEISVFEDRSFTFITKTPPASVLISKAAGIEKGAATSAKGSVGAISRAQLEEIAKTKLPDLNCSSVESAMRIIEGTARNMGVAVND